MSNFLSQQGEASRKLTEFAIERNLFPQGFTIGTKKQVTRKQMAETLLFFESLVPASDENEAKMRYKHYQEFVEEIHKPEYNCLFPEINPGFKGFKNKEV